MNEYAPTIRIKSALTFARRVLGWNGKNMERQLQEARSWRATEDRQ
jgi:hypothetical protein